MAKRFGDDAALSVPMPAVHGVGLACSGLRAGTAVSDCPACFPRCGSCLYQSACRLSRSVCVVWAIYGRDQPHVKKLPFAYRQGAELAADRPLPAEVNLKLYSCCFSSSPWEAQSAWQSSELGSCPCSRADPTMSQQVLGCHRPYADIHDATRAYMPNRPAVALT